MDDLLSEFASEVCEGYAALIPILPRWQSAPHDKQLTDEIFRYLHSVKGGAGFVHIPRIEHLAAAAEMALRDLKYWDLGTDAPQVSLIINTLERINAIAESVELGIGHPALGEAALIVDLSGHAGADALSVLPYDPQQITTIRLPLSTIDGLIGQTAALNAYLLSLGDTPLPTALALMRNDMKKHTQTVRGLRFVLLRQLFSGMERYVEELISKTGQSVTFCADDNSIEIERALLPILRNALCHLIRNAVAHGIEPPIERQHAGKPSVGTIIVTATKHAETIHLDVSDDGRGVDYQALVQVAELECYARDSALDLIQRPGISTAMNVSSLAGQGVGLDSVRIAMERIDGTLELFDRPKCGFTARLVFPSHKEPTCG
jgi:two-component system chemotaxis sensor kinase CheA